MSKKLKQFIAQATLTLRGTIVIDATDLESCVKKFKEGDFDYTPAQMELIDWQMESENFREDK